MPEPIISLNNTRLQEMPLPSTEYNKLPHIHTMADAAANHSKAHAILLGIIAAHRLKKIFTLHLVHKHFDIPEGRCMVYENIQSKAHDDFVLCSPRLPEKCPDLRGLYFKATVEGKMVAYEFTTEPGADLSAYEDFVAEFSSAVIELGVQNVFALTALSICPKNKILTEFELSEVLSTVLVSDASWLPAQDKAKSTSTDWVATQDYAQYAEGPVPGIIQLKCTQTKAGNHYNVTCSTTRSGKHYEQQTKKAGPNFGGEPRDLALEIDGEVFHEGSKPHAIVSHALSLVDII
ncbi:hypothetical protein N7524_011769 [Penicillium chrysogenum]|nr:hypothetical protein N7524_011769 [Penicillium chrysogenum]